MKGTISNKCKYEDNAIDIENFSIEYTQGADCNDDKDNIQAIKISAKNNGCGPDGWYYNIEIPEGHWSINGINDLENLIKDFESRFNLVTDYDIL